MSNKQNDEIIEKQKYTYTVTEQSVDERTTEISSTVKLTWDEIQSIYLEAFDDDKKVVKGLEGYVEWSDERFTDDEILNKINTTSRNNILNQFLNNTLDHWSQTFNHARCESQAYQSATLRVTRLVHR